MLELGTKGSCDYTNRSKGTSEGLSGASTCK